MIRIMKTGLFVLGVAFFCASPVQADYFYWQDPVSKLQVSYPDGWARVLAQKPDEVLNIAAPGAKDFAGCRVRVRADKRYAMYPARYSAANARRALGRDFWEEYLAENVAYRIHEFHDNAGLGRGFGSYVQANYVSYDDPGQQKQAVVFASLYNNKVYIVDCSAKISEFQKWYGSFISVIKSVNFRKEVHELPSGEYRPFLQDAKTYIWNGPDVSRRRGVDLKKYW